MNNPQRSFHQMLKRKLAAKVLKVATALVNKLSTWEDTMIYEEDLDHFCGKCGSKLDIVRPGKYQCPKCE